MRPLLVAGLVGAAVLACGDSGGPGGNGRHYFMGFSAIPPTPDTTLQLATLQLATQHSDAGLVQLGIPWTVLLSGIPADSEVRAVRLPLVNYYRATGAKVVVALDPTDGLDRSAEAPELVQAGRSITDTAVQRLYREYVAAVDSILDPDYLSLAAETNLIRLIAPAPLYAALTTMVNAAAQERLSHGSSSKLFVSVQVETAWGKLQGGNVYLGVAQDLADFPFIRVLGLSSYPYLGGFPHPDSIPLNYFRRLVDGTSLRTLVLEGGWPSVPIGVAASTPAMQAAYIGRQAQLLAKGRAVGWMQITLTDLAVGAWGAGIGPFAYNGLVDTVLTPKPALAAWDSVLDRRYRP